MSRTYKVTGINLKTQPIGEMDRLLTILTREQGLVRAIAMGARKHNSRLGGRSGLFVINQLLLAQGRSLDKVTQAETIESFPKLGQDLRKLTAAQYLAEIALSQALSEQPQTELFDLLRNHLQQLARSPAAEILPRLTVAIFQLLTLAGLRPQVYACCLTQEAITPRLGVANWRVGFSIPSGGVVTLASLQHLQSQTPAAQRGRAPRSRDRAPTEPPLAHLVITASQLAILQHLAELAAPPADTLLPLNPKWISAQSAGVWPSIEQLLRHYTQYHLERAIRSATLLDTCFASLDP